MEHQLGPLVVLPILGTLSLFFLVVFGTDALASKTIADLTGICYLLVSPYVFRAIRGLVPDSAAWPSLGVDPSEGYRSSPD